MLNEDFTPIRSLPTRTLRKRSDLNTDISYWIS